MQSPRRCHAILPVLTILLGFLGAQSASAQVLDPEWNHRFGDVEAQHVNAVAVDHVGNTIIVGQFDGSVRREVHLGWIASVECALWQRRESDRFRCGC